jgi:hypothetical protein
LHPPVTGVYVTPYTHLHFHYAFDPIRQAGLLGTVLLTPHPILESTAESGPHSCGNRNLSSAAWLQHPLASSYRHTKESIAPITEGLGSFTGGKQSANRLVSCLSVPGRTSQLLLTAVRVLIHVHGSQYSKIPCDRNTGLPCAVIVLHYTEAQAVRSRSRPFSVPSVRSSTHSRPL